MSNMKSCMSSLAGMLKPAKVFESTSEKFELRNPSPVFDSEVVRLKASNADLRVQLAAFKTLDIDYNNRLACSEAEKNRVLDGFACYVSQVEMQFSRIVEEHAAVEVKLRSSLDDARAEADFYKRHAAELVKGIQTSSTRTLHSRFSEDSGCSQLSHVCSSGETTEVDSDTYSSDVEDTVESATDGDTTLVADIELMLTDKGTAKTRGDFDHEHITSFIALPKTSDAPPAARMRKHTSFKSGPLKIIRERTATRRARREETKL